MDDRTIEQIHEVAEQSFDDDAPRIEIHTLAWQGAHATEVGEEPNAQIFCRVFVDGHEIPQVVRARTQHSNELSLTVITISAPVSIVEHTGESWAAL